VAGEIDQRRKYASALLLAVFFFALLAFHIPLLRLPYFWDEAGYYVPAARDLLLHGTLIPHSTPSNAHPPLVTVYLAAAWKVLSYTPVVTRTAMLAVAAFGLLGVFRLAQRVGNTEVAVASAICTALYPVFFAQSSLAHLDLAAAGLTFWGLLAYVENRRWAVALWFSLAVLAKETTILTPLALFAWELIRSSSKPASQSASRVSSRVPWLASGAKARSLVGLNGTAEVVAEKLIRWNKLRPQRLKPH
jgi:4-amino-4-deoxy-L-arabinose transferase-like glycosyltransferase